jgi:carbonic anhydrase/acetyltransferase-like protein (isoleucine patch superfamily)
MAVAPMTKSALFIAENATIVGNVTFGDGVSVWYGAVVRGDKDTITINDSSNIQDNAVVHTSTGFPVRVGVSVSIGHGAILHGCTVGDRVLVGMGAIIMNGAIIGDDSIIGAGAVITKNSKIPPNSLVLGIPGKVVRQITSEEQSSILSNAREYAKLAKRYKNGE